MVVESFLEKLRTAIEVNSAKAWPTCEFNHMTISWTKGPKYYRVLTKPKITQNDRGGSAFMFIDETGNIYKPAGFARPASGVRGHIETTDISEMDGSTRFLYARR